MTVLNKDAAATDPVAVIIPVYDDWIALSMLLAHLDRVGMANGISFAVLVVDDGSYSQDLGELRQGQYEAIRSISVLVLRLNVGHQRAICLGLSYLAAQTQSQRILVMDGDGEDSPDDVPKLLDTLAGCSDGAIIFAERRRRAESVMFRCCYAAYRYLHRFLTGIPVRVGNFSVIPRSLLDRLVCVSHLWNHYAAAVFAAKLPRATIHTSRGQRLHGKSRMNFVSLVGHGLSALSVHAELIGVRLLVLSMMLGLLFSLGLATVVVTRLFTALAIPGWATTATGLLAVLLLQVVGFAAVFAFLVLNGRSQPNFLPFLEYRHFVKECLELYGPDRVEARLPAAR